MDWTELGRFKVGKNWTYSQNFTGHIIRLSSTISQKFTNPNPKTQRGLIGLYFENSYYGLKNIYSNPNNLILDFRNLGFLDFQLAVKNTSSFSTSDVWYIDSFYWS